MNAEFSTKSLQLAIFLHASDLLPYLRTEPAGDGKVSFVFRDENWQGQQLQLEYNRGAAVAARNLFASQTFLRQQMSRTTENSNIGDSPNAIARR
jgi:hypothetical protein